MSLQQELPSPSRQAFPPKSFGACCWPRAGSASGCKIWALGAIALCSLRAQAASPRPAHPTSSDNPGKVVFSVKKIGVPAHLYNSTFECQSRLRVALHCTAITDPKFAISRTHLASGYLRNRTWIWSSLLSGISELPSQSGSLAYPHQPSKLTLPSRWGWEIS